MSDQDVKSISSATGRLPVLQSRPDTVAEQSGKPRPAHGNEMPVPAPPAPDLEALAAALNVASQSIGRELRFKVDMDSGQSVIQVLDRETGELIREIPPEKAAIRAAANGDLQLRLYDRVV